MRARLILRRFVAVLWTAAAIVLIGAGVVVGLSRLLLPFAPHFQPEIEAWLAGELDRPVEVGGLTAEWSTTGPLIRLRDVTLAQGPDARTGLTLGEAQVALNLLAWAAPGIRLTDFRVANTQVVLERTEDNRLRLLGFGDGGERGDSTSSLEWLFNQGTISVVDSAVDVYDRRRDLILRFRDVDLTLGNQDRRHRVVGSARVPAAAGGRIEFRIELEGDVARDGIRDALLYVHGEEVALSRWLQGSAVAGARVDGGRADFEVWGAVANGHARSIRGRIAVRHLALQGVQPLAGGGGVPIAPTYSADEISAHFRWLSRETGWRLDVDLGEWRRSGRRWSDSGFALARDGDTWRFGSEYLRLEHLVEALVVFDLPDERLRRMLVNVSPAGEVRGLRGRWEAGAAPANALRLEARLDHLAWQQHGRWPAMEGVSGRVSVSPGQGSLQLRSRRLTMTFPALFRAPVSLGQVSGRFDFSRRGSGWQLEAPRVRATAGGARAVARMSLLLQDDGTRPLIDLRARVSGGNAADSKDFMPVGIMHPDLVGWLDRAVVSGRVDRVRAMVYGDLDNWPFDNQRGRFEVRGHVAEAVLDYREGWPRVSDASVDLLFQGRSMKVSAHRGRVYDAEVKRVVAAIEDLKKPWLELDVTAEGPASDLLRYLRESPLNAEFGPYLQGVSVTGAARVEKDMRLPLKRELGERVVDGTVHLSDVAMRDEKWGITYEDLNGRIRFDDEGFATRDLTAVFRGHPVALSLKVGRSENPDVVATASLAGRLPPRVLLEDHPALAPVMHGLDGAAQCRVSLTVPRARKDLLGGARLKLESNMAGVAVNLPAPLTKPVEERAPLTLEMPMPFEGGVISLRYGGRLAARFRPLAPDGARAALHFGSSMPKLPDSPGLTVTGSPGRLDVDAWVAAFAGAGAGQQVMLPLNSVELQAQEVVALQREFRDVAFRVAPGPDGWRAEVDSEQVRGSLRLPRDSGTGLVAEFERLHLPPAPEGAPTQALDPRRLPPLHILAEDFSLGGTALGRSRLEAYPIRDGLRVDMVKAEAPSFTLVADGRWTVGDGGQQSDFDLTLTAENLGSMLTNFGYAGLIRDGQTIAHLDVGWPGAPTDFALQRLGGNLEVTVGPGRILPVEPGAGRVFGLLSLQQLPRRLVLDFSDLFTAGLAFDAIQGHFRFDGGSAYTDDLTLTGPSAFIRVEGSVGLAERTYDQHVTVYPSVGSTLPLVGALAGGPTGAAAMFLLQNLFEKQISQMTAYHYAVTGPWDNPDIELIETESPADIARSRDGDRGDG